MYTHTYIYIYLYKYISYIYIYTYAYACTVECQHLALLISGDVISDINSDRDDTVFVVYINIYIW